MKVLPLSSTTTDVTPRASVGWSFTGSLMTTDGFFRLSVDCSRLKLDKMKSDFPDDGGREVPVKGS